MTAFKSYIWTILTILLVLLIVVVFTSKEDLHIWRLSLVPTMTATVTPTAVPNTATSIPSATSTTIPTQTPYPTYTPIPTRPPVKAEAVIQSIHSVDKRIFVESKISVVLNYEINDYVHATSGTYLVQAGILTSTIDTKNLLIQNTPEGSTITISGITTNLIGEPNPQDDTPREAEPVTTKFWKQFFEPLVGVPYLKLNDSADLIKAQRDLAKRRACEYGILEYAADNARSRLRAELLDRGDYKYANIQIIVKRGDDCDAYNK